MTESATTLDADDVRRRLGDTTHLRGEAGWEAARLPWNRFAQQRPAIVVGARSLSDVTAALDLARTAGLTVAVQSSGHGAGAALGELEGSLLIDMAAMRGVSIDAGRRRARVEAGATWGAVMDAAARHGLAGLSGSSPDVAVAGYTLGGGVGFLSRRYGLAANAVRAIDAVLADGTVVRADPTSHSDLFWAMRGGGGSFAVVTALEIELFPVASAYGGFLLWPVQRAAEVLHAWLDWTREVPDEATTSGRLLQFPPIPNIPASVRGQSFVGVDGAILGDLAAAKALLDPLRRLGPRLDTFSEVPASALTHIHMDPEEPLPAVGDGWLVRDFDADALDSLLAVSPPASPTSLLVTEIRHLGGALSRPDPSAGCAGVLTGDHLVFGVGLAMSAELASACDHDLDAIGLAVEPWLAPRQYLNLAERPRPAAQFFDPPTLARLRAIRDAYDPGHMLLSNRPL